jgi:hypothetical protein
MVDVDADLCGNGIDADQNVDIEIEDSFLTGCGDDKTMALQDVDLSIDDKGNWNDDDQCVELTQGCNEVTDGKLSQLVCQDMDVEGNCNDVDQSSEAHAGVWEEWVGEGRCRKLVEFGSPNCLADSDLKQAQVLEACVKGNDNEVCQDVDQFATDNELTCSKLFEQAAEEAGVIGCDNEVDQDAVRIADDNCLTDSCANKLICEDADAIGSCNDVDQFAFEINNCSELVCSTELQSIEENASTVGCGNDIDQCVELEVEDNCATGGHIVQDVCVDSDA